MSEDSAWFVWILVAVVATAVPAILAATIGDYTGLGEDDERKKARRKLLIAVVFWLVWCGPKLIEAYLRVIAS